MDIHAQIKAAREAKGWSMERLAKEVSEAEGSAKTLTWQTVQQWENGSSAPKRTRMAVVRRLLDLDDDNTAPKKGEVFEKLTADEHAMLQKYRLLLDKDRKRFADEIAARAEERQAEADEFFARYGVAKAAERAHARRAGTDSSEVDVTDALRQSPLFDNKE